MTAETQQLILETIETGIDYLPKLYAGLRNMVVLLQEGKEGEGIDLFQKSLDGLEWSSSLTEAILTIPIAGRSHLLSDEWKEKAVNLRDNLRELNEAWANRDYVLIADIVEYEILPYLDLLYQQLGLFLDQQS